VPTYQYACTECGNQLEAVQSFSDAPLTECPVCSGRLRKLFSAVGVVFKGSGFYRTDSRNSNGGKGKSGAAKESVGASTGTSSEAGSSASASSSDSSSSSAATSSGSTGGAVKAPSAA
jgi:putative FmdB family regulatory protein